MRKAKRRGVTEQYAYSNSDGNPVHFEFVGVMELICLELICDSDEVWYEITERVRPAERRDQILPPESQLSAIRNHD